MARKVATVLDLLGNEIQNVLVHKVTNGASIASPKEGQIAFFTESKKYAYYSGAAWVELAAGGGVGEATSSVLGTIMVKSDLGGSGTSPSVVHFTLTSDASAGTHKVTELAAPTAAKDAANKEYVDAKVNGISWKAPVKAATAAALPAVTAAGTGATHTLTANANGVLTVDGVNIEVLKQRVLVKNQATEKDNGIYELTTKGEAGAKFVLTRTPDASTEEQLLQATLLVEEGTANKDTVWNLSNVPGFVVDTTALTFVEIQSGTAITGDGVYTTRSGAKIVLIAGEAAATVPGEGAIATVLKGAGRKAVTAITGNGALTEFTITHGLATRNIVVQGMTNAAGNPSLPVELDWETSGAEKVIIKFPAALAAATTYHVTIIG